MKKKLTKKKQPNGVPVGSASGDAAGGNGPDTSVQASPEELAQLWEQALRFTAPLRSGAPPSAEEAEAVRPQVPELRACLRTLQQRAAELRLGAEAAMGRFGSPENPRPSQDDSPAAYMQMKSQLMMSYIIGLLYYMILKVQGIPISDHPVVLQLLWIQTLLQKLKPIDQRLQYQMNKLLQTNEADLAALVAGASGATGSANDPKSLRPGELATTVEDEVDEDAAGAGANKDPQDGIYRPPKIAQVEYTGDHVSVQERAERELERKKSRLERSEFVRTLREEFTDAPAEVRGEYRSAKAEKALRRLAEQQEFEEENMIRLRAKKAELRAERRVLRESRISSGGAVSLDEVTADFRELAGGGGHGKSGGKGGKRGRRQGGSALQEYHDAVRNAEQTRRSVSSAFAGAGKGGKRRGGGGGGRGGKRRKS